jgi:HSP20 family molecular chaperone IbpA
MSGLGTAVRFLTAGELREWCSRGDKHFWAAPFELTETDSTMTLTVELPGCGAGDLQIALLPRVILVRKELRLLACRNGHDLWDALFGARTLFRRFDMPALIDVNRVTAELEAGVLTVVAPKQIHRERTAKGVPDRPHIFAI